MAFFSLLIGWLVPTAHATVLNQAGLENGAGVSGMWEEICQTLPFCDIGNQAPDVLSTKILDIISGLVVGIAIAFVIYAGIRLIMAQGDDQGLAEAKTIVTYALVGLVLSVVGRALILFIATDLLPRLLGQ